LPGSGTAASADYGGARVDVGQILGGIKTIDFVIVLYFMGFFVLGFAQGTLRRLLGIGSILFSWFLAANLAAPLSDFLGANWTQFPREYSYMIGFLTVFIASSISFALVIQGFYKPQPLFQKARFADEIIGGFLGLVQAAIIFGAILIILDTYYRIPGMLEDPQELPFLRTFWTLIDPSEFAQLFREVLIPVFFALTGFLVPDTIKRAYPAGG
jgi:membrane protein required for colicin V production